MTYDEDDDWDEEEFDWEGCLVALIAIGGPVMVIIGFAIWDWVKN